MALDREVAIRTFFHKLSIYLLGIVLRLEVILLIKTGFPSSFRITKYAFRVILPMGETDVLGVNESSNPPFLQFLAFGYNVLDGLIPRKLDTGWSNW